MRRDDGLDWPSSGRRDVRFAFGASPSHAAARRGGRFVARRFGRRGGDTDRRRDHREIDPRFVLRLDTLAPRAGHGTLGGPVIIGALRALDPLGGTVIVRALRALGTLAILAFGPILLLGAVLLLRSILLGPILPLVAVATLLLLLLGPILLLTVLLLRPILAFVAIAFLLAARLLLLLLLLQRLVVVAALVVIAFAVVVIAVVVDSLATRAALLVELRAAFAEHAEIMIGELQPIFGLDPVASLLRIARETLVFLEQLRRIATLALVAGVAPAIVARHSLGTLLSTTTATATDAVLTIIDQRDWSLSHGALTRPILSFGKKSVPPRPADSQTRNRL